MKILRKQTLIAAVLFCSGAVSTLQAQNYTTPDKVESSIGTLQYKDGAPSKETAWRPSEIELVR